MTLVNGSDPQSSTEGKYSNKRVGGHEDRATSVYPSSFCTDSLASSFWRPICLSLSASEIRARFPRGEQRRRSRKQSELNSITDWGIESVRAPRPAFRSIVPRLGPQFLASMLIPPRNSCYPWWSVFGTPDDKSSSSPVNGLPESIRLKYSVALTSVKFNL